MILHFFSPDEFRGWQDKLSPSLLVRLDAFRGIIGEPVIVSPAEGAIGRHNGPEGTSQHNIDRWGEVRAIDVMLESLKDQWTAGKYIRHATRLGFTGIGIYPDWRPYPGLHLDVRVSRQYGDPGLWGMVRDSEGEPQRMVSMDFAIDKLGG